RPGALPDALESRLRNGRHFTLVFGRRRRPTPFPWCPARGRGVVVTEELPYAARGLWRCHALISRTSLLLEARWTTKCTACGCRQTGRTRPPPSCHSNSSHARPHDPALAAVTAGAAEKSMKVVLLAVDSSPHLQARIRHVRQPTDVLLLVQAVEPPSQPVALSRWKDACHQLGIKKFSFVNVSGEPGEAIVQAAEEHEADLVVMGSRGLGTLRRTFLGSVSDYVLHHAYRPVLICPPSKRGGQLSSLAGFL
uniref:Usp domain-containing protein n=1 Tax=Macrostomum lignano TaxID=282301 RepID=A0A1I8JN84_9PLAT